MIPNNGSFFQISSFSPTVEDAIEDLPSLLAEFDPGYRVQVWAIAETPYGMKACTVFFSINGENKRDSQGLDKGIEFIALMKDTTSNVDEETKKGT